MAFSFVASSTAIAAADTTTTISLPSGIIEGDIVLVAISGDGGSQEITSTGYVNLIDVDEPYLDVSYKFMGPSPDASVDVSVTRFDSGVIIYVLRGINSSYPVINVSSGSSGTSNTPDPDGVLYPQDSSPVVLALAVIDDSTTTSVTAPAGYSDLAFAATADPTSANNSAVAIAHIVGTGFSEDPGPFAFDNSDSWQAFSIVLNTSDAAITSNVVPRSTTSDVSIPPDAEVGDLIVAMLASDITMTSANTGLTFAGFTEIAASGSAAPAAILAYKIMPADQSATIPLTAPTRPMAVAMLAVKGVDSSSPIHVSPVITTGSSNTANVASITTTVDNTVHVIASAIDDVTINQVTIPAEYLDNVSLANTSDSPADDSSALIVYRTIETAGTVPSQTIGYDASNTWWTVSLALNLLAASEPDYLGDGSIGSATAGDGFYTSDLALLGDGASGSATAGEGFYATSTLYLGTGSSGSPSSGVGSYASDLAFLGDGVSGSADAGEGFYASALSLLGAGTSGAPSAGAGFYAAVTVYFGDGAVGANAAGEGLYTSDAAYLGDGASGAASVGAGSYTSDLALLGDGSSGASTAGEGLYATVTLYAADGSIGSPAAGDGFYTSDVAYLGDGATGSPSSGEGVYLSALAYFGDGTTGSAAAGAGSYVSGGAAYLGDGAAGSSEAGQGFATGVETAATGGSTPLSRRKTRYIVESEEEKRRRRAREEYEAEEAALEAARQTPEIAPETPVELPELPPMADVLTAPLAAPEPVSAQPDTLLAEAYAAAQAAKQAELEDEEAAIMVILLAA